MFMNKINKKLRKLIAGALIIFSLSSLFIYQHNKIKDLEYQNYEVKMVQDRASDTTVTQMNQKKIEEKFNELHTYKIFDSKINFKHTYNYDRESVLGLHAKETYVATSDIYFQYDVNLVNSDITEYDNEIVISIDEPYLNKDSLHVVKDTIHPLESECSSNILTNKDDTRKVQQYYITTLEEKAYEDIEDYYKDRDDYIRDKTKKEVKELVESFVDKKVKVEINS